MKYVSPDETELFLSTPYTDVRDEAKARTTAILAKSYGQTARILLGAGILIFSLGIGIAAIVDRGHSNIKTWVAAHEPT
jgi:hypothetical protein